MGMAVLDWDEDNIRKIRVHRVNTVEVEQTLSRDPILIYEQDAGQKRDYVERRARGE